jgi:hypothetical protein
MYGNGGEGGSRLAGTAPVDGLNRADTVHMLQYAYAMYKPGGPVKGWWLRGEWGHYRDRFAPNEVISGVAFATATDPKGFSIQGWNFSTGYKLSDSIWGEDLRNGGAFTKAIEPMEFVFRYDVMQNLFYQDIPQPGNDIDVFKTQVFTGGINYYIKGHNAKIQVNYNWVLEEGDKDNPNAGGGDIREIREVSNHNLVVNFQVAW